MTLRAKTVGGCSEGLPGGEPAENTYCRVAEVPSTQVAE